MHGKTCAGTWVTGTGTDGKPREVYLHHIVDNQWSMAEYGHQAVVWQTAINPVIGLELLARGDLVRARRARPRGVRRGARSSTCSPSTARRGASRSARPQLTATAAAGSTSSSSLSASSTAPSSARPVIARRGPPRRHQSDDQRPEAEQRRAIATIGRPRLAAPRSGVSGGGLGLGTRSGESVIAATLDGNARTSRAPSV